MSYGDFDQSLGHILVHEGGYVNHPRDPGGATNKGVTQRVYDSWRIKQGQPKQSVKNIADSEVAAIYRFQYWNPILGDQLPPGVGYVVFDGAVNSGVSQSVKWLQRALGNLYTSGVDGDLGAATLAAVAQVNDYDALIGRILDQRERFLRALKTFPTFGRGWMNRLAGVKRTGQAWASGSVGPAPNAAVAAQGGNQKALLEDAVQAPGKGVADAATGGGLGAGALSGTLNQLQEQLTPYSAAGGWIENLVIGLVIVGALLTISGLAYRWYANKRRGELADALDLQPVSK